jgi:uncharacterized protein
MNIQPSAHNIISPAGGDDFIIVNVFSGNADIISKEEKNLLCGNDYLKLPPEYQQKGYLVDPLDEQVNYRLKYIDFLEQREKEEIQVFFVPTYHCNFSCSYCYQSQYPALKQQLTPEVTDSFFSFINQQFAHRKKYITLFGGEPLLDSPGYKKSIEYFIESCKKQDLTLAIVTNGYSIDKYIDLLDNTFVREIQVTLDGTGPMHDSRRKLGNNGPTFHQIVRNIDTCLQKDIAINLRMVVDDENINELPALANFAIARGWTSHQLFKTQIGRNYELHYCQKGNTQLLDRLSLYTKLLDLIVQYPQILEFHKPAFSVMKFLKENGNLPDPLFDSCPACKSEWAMDFTGSIYSCTATVGKPGERLGSFWPQMQLQEGKIKIWQQRDVLAIDQCSQCNMQLICGGGCGSIAANQSGSILSPDCRPIDGLHSLGYLAYFQHPSNQ